jgi:hypothetical protein
VSKIHSKNGRKQLAWSTEGETPMKEPLPCPFCGGDVSTGEQKPIPPYTETRYHIQCFDNDCNVWPELKGVHTTLEEAIAAWNKRSKI